MLSKLVRNAFDITASRTHRAPGHNVRVHNQFVSHVVALAVGLVPAPSVVRCTSGRAYHTHCIDRGSCTTDSDYSGMMLAMAAAAIVITDDQRNNTEPRKTVDYFIKMIKAEPFKPSDLANALKDTRNYSEDMIKQVLQYCIINCTRHQDFRKALELIMDHVPYAEKIYIYALIEAISQQTVEYVDIITAMYKQRAEVFAGRMSSTEYQIFTNRIENIIRYQLATGAPSHASLVKNHRDLLSTAFIDTIMRAAIVANNMSQWVFLVQEMPSKSPLAWAVDQNAPVDFILKLLNSSDEYTLIDCDKLFNNACASNNINFVTAVLRKYPNMDAIAIHQTAKNHPKVGTAVNTLYKLDPTHNFTQTFLKGPSITCKKTQIEALQYWVEAGASVDVAAKTNDLLNYALRLHDPPLVRILIEQGIKPTNDKIQMISMMFCAQPHDANLLGMMRVFRETGLLGSVAKIDESTKKNEPALIAESAKKNEPALIAESAKKNEPAPTAEPAKKPAPVEEKQYYCSMYAIE